MDCLHLDDVVFDVPLECSQGNGSTPQNYIMKLSQVKGLAERLLSFIAELTNLQFAGLISQCLSRRRSSSCGTTKVRKCVWSTSFSPQETA